MIDTSVDGIGPAASTESVGVGPAQSYVMDDPPSKRVGFAPVRFGNDPRMYLPPKAQWEQGQG